MDEFEKLIKQEETYDPTNYAYEFANGQCYDTIWVAALALNCTDNFLKTTGEWHLLFSCKSILMEVIRDLAFVLRIWHPDSYYRSSSGQIRAMNILLALVVYNMLANKFWKERSFKEKKKQ